MLLIGQWVDSMPRAGHDGGALGPPLDSIGLDLVFIYHYYYFIFLIICCCCCCCCRCCCCCPLPDDDGCSLRCRRLLPGCYRVFIELDRVALVLIAFDRVR